METFNSFERESTPKNISSEFLSMDRSTFRRFLKTLKDEPVISIEIDWVDVPTARKLKAFLEDSNAFQWNQKRTATICATQEQHDQELNVFESGVKWEKK